MWTTPVFSLGAMVSLALPLFIVTMASQNLPGVAVLAAFGYRPAPGPLIATTGVFTLLVAPFGGHSVNLSSIIAALCAGEDASPDPARRWIAAASNGAACVVFGLLAGGVAHFVAGSPILVEAVAGLALLNAFGGALSGALANADEREAALATFLVTASGVSFFGVGGAFWGLVVGAAVLALDRARDKRASPPAKSALSRVEPVEPLQHALGAERAHRQVARQGERAGEMVDAPLHRRLALDAIGARDAVGGIGGERGFDVVRFAEPAGERVGVLDRLRRALGEERRHRMRRVADQRDAAEGVTIERRPQHQRPGAPAFRRGDQIARVGRPVAKGAVERLPVGLAVPRIVASRLRAARCASSIRSPRRG